MKRFLNLLLIILLLTGYAAADLKRGDRGEAVVSLQAMMIEAGALDDVADGIFGRKTENAVKDLQGYFGMKKTGKANDSFLLELEDIWRAVTGNGSEGGMDAGDMEGVEDYCLPEGLQVCYRHEEAVWVESFLKRKGKKPPQAVQERLLERACILWYNYTVAMYNEWENQLSKTQKHIAREQKQIYLNAYAEVSSDYADYYRKNRVRELTARLEWLREMGQQECYDHYGQEGNGG